MTDTSELELQLAEKRETLAAYKSARTRILHGGVSEWTTRDGDSSRSVKNLSLSELEDKIRKLEAEIASLVAQISGDYSAYAFRIGPYIGG